MDWPAVYEARAGRRTAYATLACTLAAGIVVLLEAGLTDLPGPASFTAWWVSFAVLVGVQLVATGLVPRPRRTPHAVWLVALVVAALTTFLLYPEHGLTAAFLVASAATVARHCPTRVVLAVIGLQTVLATVAIAVVDWPLVDVLAGVVVFAGFQAFGALVVQAARRETEARHELARAHAELRATVVLLEEATRSTERLRIARDLHDVLGHHLTALALELEVASHSAPGDVHVERARSIAKGLLHDVRASVGQIREETGPLEASLRALADDVPGLTIRVRVDARVGPEQSAVVLRCAQEAITNALRHADAHRLDLVVEPAADGIRFSAADDGRGVAAVVLGHGLTGMRERVESLGGELSVRSGPGAGFGVVATLPHRGPTPAPEQGRP